MRRCPGCLQRVATKYQHRVDDRWLCEEPTAEVLLGSDPQLPPNINYMDDSTRQAIDDDVRTYGKAFGVIGDDGKLKRLPPDKVITFDDEGATVTGEYGQAGKPLRDASASYLAGLRKAR
jgi:hypothetical protein